MSGISLWIIGFSVSFFFVSFCLSYVPTELYLHMKKKTFCIIHPLNRDRITFFKLYMIYHWSYYYYYFLSKFCCFFIGYFYINSSLSLSLSFSHHFLTHLSVESYIYHTSKYIWISNRGEDGFYQCQALQMQQYHIL